MSEENLTNAASSSRSKQPLNLHCKNSKEAASNLTATENGDDGDTKNMLFANFPNEILGKILSQVSFDDLFHLEIVCKRMRNVVKSVVWPIKDSLTHESIIQYTNYPYIPQQINKIQCKSMQNHKITRKSVEAVLSRANNIRNLNLSIYFSTINQEVCSLLLMVPKLVKLDLSFIRLKNADLFSIAHSCPKLEEISLERCFSKKGKFDDGLKTLCKRCPNIKYMNLTENRIGNFFEFLPHELLYLNLENSNFTSNDMNVLARRVPNLETLILDYLNNYKPFDGMNDWLSKLTKLRFLQIDRFSSPRPLIPPLNFTNLNELEKLRLCANDLVGPSTVESLKNCAKLKFLDLSYNSLDKSRTFETLKKCKALKYCDFSGWANLNDGLIDFIQHNQIEKLKLDKCELLTKSLIGSLIIDCESLNYLVLWSCKNNKYNGILSSVLSEKHSPRKNTLKLIIPSYTKLSSSSSCEWCEVIPWKSIDPRPFPDFTNVQIQ